MPRRLRSPVQTVTQVPSHPKDGLHQRLHGLKSNQIFTQLRSFAFIALQIPTIVG